MGIRPVEVARALLVLSLGACAAGELHPDGRASGDRKRPREAALDDQLAGDGALLPDLRRDLASGDQRAPDLRKPDLRPPDLRPPDTKPAAPQVLLSLDFEAGKAGLVATKDWQWGVLAFKAGTGCDAAAKPPTACHSGTHCWGTILNDCYSPLGNAANECANVSTTDDSVLTLDTAIPASYKSARLTFWEWRDYFLPYDWAEVRVNGSVVYQDCKTSYVAPTAWTKRTILLNGYLGKSVSIAWHFMATTVVNHSGWYLDDVVIEEY